MNLYGHSSLALHVNATILNIYMVVYLYTYMFTLLFNLQMLFLHNNIMTNYNAHGFLLLHIENIVFIFIILH